MQLVHYNLFTRIFKSIESFHIKRLELLVLSQRSQVKQWCNSNNVEWLEFPSNGVIRGLTDRDLWKKKLDSRMRIELHEPPNLESISVPNSDLFDRTSIGLKPRKLSYRREAGESAAVTRLADFLEHEAKISNGEYPVL